MDRRLPADADLAEHGQQGADHQADIVMYILAYMALMTAG
jgi:hypothetical protein